MNFAAASNVGYLYIEKMDTVWTPTLRDELSALSTTKMKREE